MNGPWGGTWDRRMPKSTSIPRLDGLLERTRLGRCFCSFSGSFVAVLAFQNHAWCGQLYFILLNGNQCIISVLFGWLCSCILHVQLCHYIFRRSVFSVCARMQRVLWFGTYHSARVKRLRWDSCFKQYCILGISCLTISNNPTTVLSMYFSLKILAGSSNIRKFKALLRAAVFKSRDLNRMAQIWWIGLPP